MKLGLVAALALAVALPIGIAAQQQTRPQTQPPTSSRPQTGQVGTTGAASSATVNDILDNPERYYGQTVMVSGEVGEVHGNKAFTIEESGMGGDELLVLWKKESPGASGSASSSYGQSTSGQTGTTRQTGMSRQSSGTTHSISKGSTVQATGTVRRFSKSEIQSQHSIEWREWAGSDQSRFDDYENKPVLIATKVDVRSKVNR
ncbi:MAG: hypothetical protein ACE148_16865 [Vicinamibacterales bacterium]